MLQTRGNHKGWSCLKGCLETVFMKFQIYYEVPPMCIEFTIMFNEVPIMFTKFPSCSINPIFTGGGGKITTPNFQPDIKYSKYLAML